MTTTEPPPPEPPGIGDPLNPCDECNEPGHVGVCKLWGGVHKFLCLETGKANNIPRAGVDPFDCGCVMTTEPPTMIGDPPGEDCPKKCFHGYIDACKKHGEGYKSTCAPPNTNLPKPGVEPFNCECEMVTGIGDPLNPCDECNEPGHVGVCKLWGGVHKFLCLETGKCRMASVPKSAFMDTSTPVRNTVKGTSPRVRHLTQICLNRE
eukprot:445808_1